jgi:signal peptidase I
MNAALLAALALAAVAFVVLLARRPTASRARLSRRVAWLACSGAALGLAGLAGFVWAGPCDVYVVRTGSMSPAIPPTSVVVVDPGARYQRGDVITFSDGGAITTHRYLGTRADGTLITKGDANRTKDPFAVRPANVRGTVVASADKLGWLIIYLRQPTGVLSLLIAPLAVWLAWGIVTWQAPPRRAPRQAP